MGYIPDLDQQSSSRKKMNYTKKRQGRGQRTYHHRLLRAILKNVHDCEAKGGIDFMLRIGNQVKRVRLHIIVMVKVETCFVVVLVVTQACDALAGHVTVSTQECCSNSNTECVYLLRVTMEEIFENTKSNDDDVAKQAKIDLHQLSQHAMELATSLLSFGGDKH
eukprot:scaffold33151_cov81-Attheya_sp.AAC.1